MAKIKHEGTFIGYAMQSGIGKTKANGFPQWIAKFQAVSEYDFDSQTFIDIFGTEEVEITGYFVIFDKEGKATLNAKQIKEAYKDTGIENWSMRALNGTDFSAIPVQFRVEEHEYEGKKSMQVSWIDHLEATPGGSIAKMTDDEVNSLDAKFANAFRELNGGDKPKSVPVSPAKKAAAITVKPTKPLLPKKPVAPLQSTEETEEPTSKALAQEMAKAAVEEQKTRAAAAEYAALSPTEKKQFAKKQKAETKKPAILPVKPKKPGPPKSVPSPVEETVVSSPAQELIAALDLPESCTQEEAWEVCETNKDAAIADDKLAEEWTKVVENEFGSDDLVEANNAWAEVRDRVLKTVIVG